MLMGELTNLLAPRYYKMLPGEEIMEGFQRIKQFSVVDLAKEENYDIAANDVSLGGECALAKLQPDEAKKAYNSIQSKELNTEDFTFKNLLSVFWKDNSEKLHKLTKRLGFGGKRSFFQLQNNSSLLTAIDLAVFDKQFKKVELIFNYTS